MMGSALSKNFAVAMICGETAPLDIYSFPDATHTRASTEAGGFHFFLPHSLLKQGVWFNFMAEFVAALICIWSKIRTTVLPGS